MTNKDKKMYDLFLSTYILFSSSQNRNAMTNPYLHTPYNIQLGKVSSAPAKKAIQQRKQQQRNQQNLQQFVNKDLEFGLKIMLREWKRLRTRD